MARTPEGEVKDAVKLILNSRRPHVWSLWPVPGGYGESTLDCIGTCSGISFAIETKAPGVKTLTPRQEALVARMRAAEVKVFIIPLEDSYDDLKHWLDLTRLWGIKRANHAIHA